MTVHWHPDPLSVGDRVRVRLNGECRFTVPADPDIPGDTDFLMEHDVAQHGLTGVIDEISDDPWFGHGYGVAFDHPYILADEDGPRPIVWYAFARVELDRLD